MWSYEHFLDELQEMGLVEVDYEDEVMNVNKDALLEIVTKNLEFQRSYCKIFNVEKLSDYIFEFPQKLSLDNSLVKHKLDRYGFNSEKIFDTDDVEEDPPLEVHLSDASIDKLASAIAAKLKDILSQ